jgi:type VI secretion system secreted protein VgrG
MPQLELTFQSGETSLSVRRFSIHEAVSTPFTVSIWARSPHPTIDLGAIAGQPAAARITAGFANVLGGSAHAWSGLCSYIEQVRGERRPSADEQSLYYLRIVPTLWLLTHRRGNRIFQRVTIPEIVTKILGEWGVEHAWKVDAGQYPKHEYRVQYGETDFQFVSRLLEEAGIAYTFDDDGKSTLVFNDELQRNQPRGGVPIPYEHNPTQAAEREYIARIELVHQVRPGAVTIRDHDHRNPAYALLGEAPKAKSPEDRYEQYHYMPGGMFVETGKGGNTPFADDKIVARHDEAHGKRRAARMLESFRADRAGIGFESNVLDLAPGVVFEIDNHPHPELEKQLLVVDVTHEGTAEGEWGVYGHAVFTDAPYRPPLVTPKPDVRGVQVARVVGPVEEEIHTDEFGRIRVQFPWDREGVFSDDSSCWIRVGEGWGGEAYGWIDVPRVGHEVLVSYLEGDPDRPIITGRAYNIVNPVPYKLPDHKTVSAWKSRSYPNAHGGWYNEIKFEDQKGEELFYTQAQKDQRALVKNDESITVGHDRDKIVNADETEVTGVNRTQVVGVDRSELTGTNLTTVVLGKKLQHIVGDESEHTRSSRLLLVEKDQDVVVRGSRRERVEYDRHAHVVGNRAERVKKTHSLMVLEEKHEKVGETFAREAGNEHHIVAGEELVGEAAADVTLKGPGGFIRIDATGVSISGTFVKINVSGRPGHGHGVNVQDPAEAKEAAIPVGALWNTGPVQDQAGNLAIREQLMQLAMPKEKQIGPTAIALMKLASIHDVSTPHDGAIFWSGGNDFAGKAADQLAARRSNGEPPRPSVRLEGTVGGSTLGNTSAGIGENKKTGKQGAPWAEQQPAWRVISRRFAAGASGEVTAVVGNVPVGEDAILREEVKLLRANKKVTAIRFLAIQKDENGKAVTDAEGNYVLVPVSAKEVLAPPPKEEKK